MGQLPLFDEDLADAGGAASQDEARLRHEHALAEPIARRLPPLLKFGTSSWSFPGWRGLVFASARSVGALARDGLRDYARHPLLRTVGVDRSYYAPVTDHDLRHYLSLVPPSFGACFKAPAAVTSFVLPASGKRSGSYRANPEFLSLDRLELDLLGPLDRSFPGRTDVVILEFPPVPTAARPGAAEFLERLEHFLEHLPRGFRYVVELRERHLFTASYRSVLERTAVGHVYNYWSRMPMPLEQWRQVPLRAGVVSCVRLLMRPGSTYEDQRARFAPFNRLVAPDQAMRREVTTIALDAAARKVPLMVLVNNKAEGSAPLTISALSEAVAHGWRDDRPDSPSL